MTTRLDSIGLVAVLLVCAALQLPAPAHAEEAQQLYRDGISLFEQGSYKEAAEAFRKAYSLKASWKMHYNIGQSEAAAHRYGLALDAFETYLVQGGDDISVERREAVLAEIQRLRLLVGVVELQAAPGCELLIDGTTRGTVPFPGTIRVAAGDHEIVVRQDGAELLKKHVRVAGGMTTNIDAREESGIEPDEPAAAPDTAQPPVTYIVQDAPRAKLISGLVVGGLGLVGVGLGTGFVIKGNADHEDYTKAKEAGNDDKADEIWNNDIRIDSAVTVTGFVVGGVLLTTGVVLIAVDVVQHKKAETDQEVALKVVPGGLGLTF